METRNRVVITGVDLPFMDCVNLILRLALAAIPALILFSVFVGVIMAVLGALLAGGAK